MGKDKDHLELVEAFKLFDTDNDGEVTIQELQALFQKLKSEDRIKRSEVQALLRAADKDKSGTVNMEEFKTLWQQLKAFGDDMTEDEKVIREEFDKLDADGSGFISKSEMMATIEGCEFLGSDKEAEAKRCLDDIDVDGDGKISYPEFLMVWKFKY